MSREWSHYQSAIFDFVSNGTGHGVVLARAGSGKTTVIEECVRRLPAGRSCLVLAFNTSIAKELASRLPRTAHVMTTHSCGRRLCERAFPGTTLLESKTWDLINERYPAGRVSKPLAASVVKGVSLAKNTLASTRAEIEALIDEYNLEVFKSERRAFVDITLDILNLSAEVTHVIDFDDMIWLPVRHSVAPTGFDYVFVDETQDLNASQIKLALSLVKPTGRIIAVGDPRQAIYGFRGADRFAVDRVTEALNATVLPLSVTYRCARSIVRAANEIVPDLEAAPHAIEGSVSKATEDQCVNDASPGDFVLSRTNAPLVKLTLEFIAAGRPARMLGRDIGDGLLKLVRRSRAESVRDLLSWVDAWAERQAEQLMKKDKSPDLPRDQAECLRRIAAECATVADVESKVRSLFDDEATDDERITLSSTHKAKGLERDRVWLLRSTYLRNLPWSDKTEEENLYYVGCTRARSDLRLVG